MTYDETELSTQDGHVLYLYEFNRQDIIFYRYTNVDQDIDFEGNTYLSMPISNAGFVKSGESDNDTFEITLPAATPIALLFNGTPPSDPIAVTVRKLHRDPNTGEITDAPVVWVGSITGRSKTGANSLTFQCDALTISFSRGGLRLSYTLGCPHMLYDTSCKVDKSAFQFNIPAITVASGRILQAEELRTKPTGWFDGGFIEWTRTDGAIERRGLETHENNELQVFGTTDGITDGQAVRVFPGCDRTINTCFTKFNNVLNYGGCPYLPGKSPFDGDPVFQIPTGS